MTRGMELCAKFYEYRKERPHIELKEDKQVHVLKNCDNHMGRNIEIALDKVSTGAM